MIMIMMMMLMPSFVTINIFRYKGQQLILKNTMCARHTMKFSHELSTLAYFIMMPIISTFTCTVVYINVFFSNLVWNTKAVTFYCIILFDQQSNIV